MEVIKARKARKFQEKSRGEGREETSQRAEEAGGRQRQEGEGSGDSGKS
jgi:hypothetical protein